MSNDDTVGLTRRKLLIGGGVGAGLLVSWGLWPRKYRSNLVAAKQEHVFGAWLKISEDGQVIVGIPQSESGQGVFTALAQIIAGELGADWRTVAVQPAMPSPNFANHLLAHEWATAFVPESFDPQNGGPLVGGVLDIMATRQSFVVTGGSSSVRQFELPCRQAGAAARILLCKAAAKRWDTNWESCDTDKGFVTFGKRRLAFAELVVEAAKLDVPDPLPLRASPINHLSGKEAPRLDLPAKVDGSASFAGDVRLPDMLYASIRSGPIGNTRLKSINRKGANAVKGLVDVVRTDDWVAALATNWWAANQALDALKPIFETTGKMADSGKMAEVLDRSIAKGSGRSLLRTGSVEATLTKGAGTRVYHADYSAAPAVHAPLETRSATAHFNKGRLQLWIASQAPEAAKQAAAKAIGISSDDVVLYPMFAGGSFDRNFDNLIAAQVAVLSKQVERPVQLIWSRPEDFMRDHYRAPALGRMTASLNGTGQIAGLSVKIATSSAMRELAGRMDGNSVADARAAAAGEYDPLAIAGATPPYAISNLTIDHFPADIPIPTGPWRSMAHSYTAFFIESFIDELAHKAGIEPLSYRMQMLVGQTRLARCLTGVAAMAGWDGGLAGSSKGIACHSMAGSHIALIVSAKTGENGVRVDSISAMVDCGRIINPDLARQQIEGGIVFGLAQALGASTEFENGLPLARRLRDIDLPLLADVPEISVEFIRSDLPPGGLSEIGVPAVAPAIANALFSASGLRLRELPLLSKGL
jgi:isoquinoline 1-oxidoreductase subunit beta